MIKRTMQIDKAEQICDLMCGKPEDEEHEYCLRCGRKLKSEEARVRGYGMVCIKKLKTENKNRLF